MINPVCTAIIFCEKAAHDPATGRFTLTGVFTSLSSPTYPFTFGSLGLYVSVQTMGEQAFNLQVRHSRDRTIISTWALPQHKGITVAPQIVGPATKCVGMTFGRITFPEPDLYEVEVLLDGKPVGFRLLQLT